MSSLIHFHKRMMFLISVCFFLSQSLKASEYCAWKFDIPRDQDPTYPFAQIIIQKEPISTLTLVYAVSMEEPRAQSLKRKFQRFLKKNYDFKGYITQDEGDHFHIEHFGCNWPYRNHVHISFNSPLTEETLDKILTLLELDSYKNEMLILFRRFFDQDWTYSDVHRILQSVSSILVLRTLMLPSDSI